jgi:hypothetical protein
MLVGGSSWVGRAGVEQGALMMGGSVFKNGRALEWDVNFDSIVENHEGVGEGVVVVVGAGIFSGWFAVLSTAC